MYSNTDPHGTDGGMGVISFVTTPPYFLRNNLVNRLVEILLKSFAGSYSAYKYFFFSEDLNLI